MEIFNEINRRSDSYMACSVANFTGNTQCLCAEFASTKTYKCFCSIEPQYLWPSLVSRSLPSVISFVDLRPTLSLRHTKAAHLYAHNISRKLNEKPYSALITDTIEFIAARHVSAASSLYSHLTLHSVTLSSSQSSLSFYYANSVPPIMNDYVPRALLSRLSKPRITDDPHNTTMHRTEHRQALLSMKHSTWCNYSSRTTHPCIMEIYAISLRHVTPFTPTQKLMV